MTRPARFSVRQVHPAHVTTFTGTDLYAVGGTCNSYSHKAVLTRKERLDATR